MINLKMIADGYAAGIIKIIDSPHEDGAVCQIGDIWFYFGGEEAESSSAEEYKKNVPDADIINEIFSALEDFKISGDEFLDEYMYYECYLSERLQGTITNNKITL